MNTSKQQTFWNRTPVIILMGFICGFLWGSAFPCVKIGYRLFSVASDDMASQLLFAGVRFTLAGILVILFGSIGAHRLLIPARVPTEQNASAEPRFRTDSFGESLRMIVILCLFQTIGQYFFFYIGLAHTSGVKSSVVEASSTFFAILAAALLFRSEKLTLRKIAGCLIGFAGVLVILIPGSTIDLHIRADGEGFILISTLMYAVSSSLIKRYSKKEDTVVLSGYQFILGGLVLAAAGAAMGGRISGFAPASVLLLLYMALISAVAYTLWSLLMKHNPVSKIAMFGFLNPVLGVLLSALLLGEQNQAFSIYALVSLLLISAGIIIVYRLDT